MPVRKLYTSDLHFGHKNIIDYDQRPFKTLEQMEEVLISNWNNKVTDNDDVYIVGDIGLCSRSHIVFILKQLQGNLHLIIGNHDEFFVSKSEFRNRFSSIDQIKRISDGGVKIILCHYPMRSWKGSLRGYSHFYGHIHNSKGNNPFIYENSVNVGCMMWDYTPVTFEEIFQKKRFYDSFLQPGQKNISSENKLLGVHSTRTED